MTFSKTKKDFRCFSQPQSFACIKECRKGTPKTIVKTVASATNNVEGFAKFALFSL